MTIKQWGNGKCSVPPFQTGNKAALPAPILISSCFVVPAGNRGQRFEVGNDQVGLSFDCTRGPVTPAKDQRCRYAQRFGRKHIVIDALSDMEHPISRQAETLERHAEWNLRRLVGFRLL